MFALVKLFICVFKQKTAYEMRISVWSSDVCSSDLMHIDVSMLGSSLAIAALQTSEYFGSGKNPQKLGSAHPRNAPYQVFRCRDGYFGMAAGNNEIGRASCRERVCQYV